VTTKVYVHGTTRTYSDRPTAAWVSVALAASPSWPHVQTTDDLGRVTHIRPPASIATDAQGRWSVELVHAEGVQYLITCDGVTRLLDLGAVDTSGDDPLYPEGAQVEWAALPSDFVTPPPPLVALDALVGEAVAAEVAEQVADPGSAMSLAIAAAGDAASIAAQDAATAAQTALLTPGALPARFTNLITDPTYQTFGAAGWSFLGGTGVHSGVNASVTGNGTISGIGLYTSSGQAFTGKAAHRYYVRVEMAIPDSSANSSILLSVSLSDNTDNTTHQYVGGFQTAIAAPVKDRKYTISGVVTLPDNYEGAGVRLYLRAYFADAAAANGSQVHLYDYPVVYDLTDASPAMPEPTKEVLDREIATASAVAPVTNHTRAATTILDRTFATRVKKSVASGPHVVLRFDDGFLNNLTVAAPILARYGYPGTLYTCTGDAELGGVVVAGHPLMTPDQVKTLWDTYGWEVGAHTRLHEDAVDTPIDTWRTSIRGSMLDIVGWGLPRPTTMAYPNGSRNAATDKLVYGLFDMAALTGDPNRAPWPYHKGHFFTGWGALGGATDADGKLALARVKQYIRASFDQGSNPVVGMHGITVAQPSYSHFARADLLADLCQWLWAEGYPVSTQSDAPRHNMIVDPRLTTQDLTTGALGGHPWTASTTNGWERLADVNALSGYCARLAAIEGIAAGSQTLVGQQVTIQGGKSYKVYLHHCSPVYTSGAVVARIAFLDVLGNTIGTPIPAAATINSTAPTTGAGGLWVGGTPFAAPDGACVARIDLLPDSTLGITGDIRVDCVAMFPTDTYDPLA
jgi:peptidoglycan/xylan/chitin deacetylase (PgdA/CDA1 family)